MINKLLIALILTFSFVTAISNNSIAGSTTEDIQWIHTYDQGIKNAKDKDKNMFVLITAPDWCYYCKQFEKNVLSIEKIQNILNESYIPLMVLDQVDGKRNPDLSKFTFPGFPTIFVYNKSGEMIKNISTNNADTMLELLKKYSEIKEPVNLNDRNNIARGRITKESREKIDDFLKNWIKN